MAEVSVWHDLTGAIVAVGRATGSRSVIPLAGTDRLVLTTEIDEEEIPKLHQTYVVDVTRKALVRRERDEPRYD